MVVSKLQKLMWDMDAGHKVYTIYSILALVFVILVSPFLHICTATKHAAIVAPGFMRSMIIRGNYRLQIIKH